MFSPALLSVLKLVLLAFGAFSFGVVAAAGVFTVFSSVGLVPRYVGRFHEARDAMLYENLVILGTMTGSVVQLFSSCFLLGNEIKAYFGGLPLFWLILSGILQLLMGIFYGIFVGTLALSIAEMLDSIPIFTRRVRLEKGIPAVIVSIALGKMLGALLYFYYDF